MPISWLARAQGGQQASAGRRTTWGLPGVVREATKVFIPYGLTQDGTDTAFELSTDQGQTVAVAQDARKRLSDAGFKAEVSTSDRSVNISVSTTDREKVRTVLYDVVPDEIPLTDAETDEHEAGIFLDLRLGVALPARPGLRDGCGIYRSRCCRNRAGPAAPVKALRRSGVPLKVIEQSARLAAIVPVVGVGLPVVGFGALCGLALSGGQILTQGSSGVVLLVGQVAVGLVLVAVAGAAGAPVLRRAGVG